MSIFSRIISAVKGIFGGKPAVEDNQSNGHSEVYLPDSHGRNERRQRRQRPERADSSKASPATRKSANRAGDSADQQKQGRPARGQKSQGRPSSEDKSQGRPSSEDKSQGRPSSDNKPSRKPSRGGDAGRQKAQDKAPERVIPSMDGWEIPERQRKEDGEVFFQDFDLDRRILRALLENMGFRCCSPIQGQSLPLTLAGQDLAGKAQTGTGKTAAFLVTVIQRFLEQDKSLREPWQPMSVILAPTRELAIQIANDAADISAFCPEFRTVAVYGGMDYDRQMTELASNVDLVVATPGRLIDYLRKHAVDLSKVSIAVIDEADRMLDMGFIPDVKRIMAYLPKPEDRQTMLFSATLNQDIMQLASRWMKSDTRTVEIEPEHVLAEGIDETVYAVTTAEKIPVMLWLFKHEDCRRVLIFRNRKKDVEALQAVLARCGVQCEMLTGDVDQKKRLRILDGFRDGSVKIIVATDVAGRGIHVDDVTHVINYDLPYEAEDYVHRVGRTARAGHKGRAISFADEDCAFVIPEIEKIIERPLPITQPEDEMLEMPPQLKNISSARASGIHRSESFGHGGSRRRSFGSYGRR